MDSKWWIQKSPNIIVTFLWITTIYFGLWSWVKSASFLMTEQKGEEIFYLPWLFGKSDSVLLLGLIGVCIWAVFGWLLSTRISFYQSKHMRVITFFTMGLTVWGGLSAYGMSEARKRMLPFFETRLLQVFEGNNTDTGGILEQIVFGQIQGFYMMIVAIPVLLLFFISYFLLNKYVEFDKELNEAFFQFEWKGKWLQKMSRLEQQDYWPDLELGRSSEDKEVVVLLGRDRTVGTMIVGSPGTGKTAALAEPMIDNDLDHMVKYIEDYPEMYQREDYKSETVSGRYLSGISIIDPSNDLCQNSLKLVKAHGIPDEAITYINPLDPNTPSINPMRGPVDKVAEVFAQVIAGLSDTGGAGNFYFEQAQRNHLKYHIYLLKLHDVEKEVTLDMLLDMYNNPQLVRSMHVALKTTIPPGIDDMEDRDERNYWKIVQGVDDWFNLNLIPKVTRSGPVLVPEYDEDGQPMYQDVLETDVKGLRNILNDIGANILIRRVLFGKSEFDFDRHMEIGGVLLVNTAKGELVDLARVLGKIVLMNLQNATFRREPRVSTFHHILVDEAPDYLYKSFKEFPAQSRKYKVILTTLQQTIAQLADQFGEHYMTTLIGTLRNRMVYGDVPGFDADYFSKLFGEKIVYEEGQSEMSVSPLQEDPVSRSGSSYSKVRDSAMTGADIMFQEAFQCAVKIVKKNKPMPVVQIDANFVDRKHYSVARVVAVEEDTDVWLESRRNYGVKITPEQTKDILSVEETEKKNKEFYDDRVVEANEKQEELITIGRMEKLDPQMVDKAVSTHMDTQPRDEVRYVNGIPSAAPIKHSATFEEKAIVTRKERIVVNESVDSTDTDSSTSSDTIVDVILPKVSRRVPVEQEETKPAPIPKEVTEEVAPIKVKAGALVMNYEEELEPTHSQGYTPSQVTEKGEEFLKELRQLSDEKK